MFDWEHGFALHPKQGIRATSPAVADVTWDFSSCGRKLGYIIQIQRGWPFELHFVQRSQDSCVVRTDTSGP